MCFGVKTRHPTHNTQKHAHLERPKNAPSRERRPAARRDEQIFFFCPKTVLAHACPPNEETSFFRTQRTPRESSGNSGSES